MKTLNLQKSKGSILLAIIILLFTSSLSYTQHDSIYMMKTKTFNVMFLRHKQLLNPKTGLTDTIVQQMAVTDVVQVNYLKNSNVIIKKDTIINNININNIQKLTFYEKGSFWNGALYGAVIGMVSGALGGYLLGDGNSSAYSHSGLNKATTAISGGLAFAFLGSIVGGLISSSSNSEDEYDISHYPTDQKTVKLIKLFRQNKKL